jgi:transcription initiation factor TFIIIB Brf1 subunit/transcription initiation factor TFIIB
MEKHGEVVCGIERPVHEIVSEAIEYIEEFYRENNLPKEEKESRITEIVADIKRQG